MAGTGCRSRRAAEGTSIEMRSASAAMVREISWERVACPRLSKKQPTLDNVESLINSLTAADPGTIIFTVANRNVLTVIGDSEQRSEERRVGKECRSRW